MKRKLNTNTTWKNAVEIVWKQKRIHFYRNKIPLHFIFVHYLRHIYLFLPRGHFYKHLIWSEKSTYFLITSSFAQDMVRGANDKLCRQCQALFQQSRTMVLAWELTNLNIYEIIKGHQICFMYNSFKMYTLKYQHFRWQNIYDSSIYNHIVGSKYLYTIAIMFKWPYIYFVRYLHFVVFPAYIKNINILLGIYYYNLKNYQYFFIF